jgi:hypothetical protein
LRRIWLFSADKTQLIVELNSSVRQIIVILMMLKISYIGIDTVHYILVGNTSGYQHHISIIINSSIQKNRTNKNGVSGS